MNRLSTPARDRGGPDGGANPAPGDRSTIDRADPDRSRRLGACVLVATAAWNAWLLSRGWFFSDDLYNLTEALDRPFGWDYLTRDLFGHVVPGFMTVVWAVAHPGGADYTWAAASTVVGLVGVVALVRAVAARLGASPVAAWAAAAVTGANVAWAATTWWAAAINWVPSAAFGMIFLLGHLRWLEDRRVRHLIVAALSLGLALSFQEGSTAFLVTVLVITLTHHLDGPPAARARGLVSLWPAWAAYAVPLVATAALWATSANGFGGGRPDPASWAAFPFVFALEGYLPAQVGLSLRFVDGPLVPVVVLATLAATVALVPRWLRRTGPKGWVPLLVVAATVWARGLLVGWARLPTSGFYAARDQRYLVDLVWIAPALFAAAWSSRPRQETATGTSGRTERRGATAVVGALVVVGLLGQISEAPSVGSFGAKAYRDRFEGSYRRALDAEPDAVLLDIAAGPDLAPALLARFSLLSRTATFATGPVPFNDPDRPLLAPGEDGTVRPVRLDPVATARLERATPGGAIASAAADRHCWRAGPSDALVTIPLDDAVAEGTHVLVLDGVAASSPWSREAPPTITAESPGGAERLAFVVHGAGSGHVLLTPTPFAAETVRITVPAGRELCLRGLTVADLAPR